MTTTGDNITRGMRIAVTLPNGTRAVCEVVAIRHSPVDFVELRPIGGGATIPMPLSRLRVTPEIHPPLLAS